MDIKYLKIIHKFYFWSSLSSVATLFTLMLKAPARMLPLHVELHGVFRGAGKVALVALVRLVHQVGRVDVRRQLELLRGGRPVAPLARQHPLGRRARAALLDLDLVAAALVGLLVTLEALDRLGLEGAAVDVAGEVLRRVGVRGGHQDVAVRAVLHLDLGEVLVLRVGPEHELGGGVGELLLSGMGLH